MPNQAAPALALAHVAPPSGCGSRASRTCPCPLPCDEVTTNSSFNWETTFHRERSSRYAHLVTLTFQLVKKPSWPPSQGARLSTRWLGTFLAHLLARNSSTQKLAVLLLAVKLP